MAAPYNPPVKNEDFITYVSLGSVASSSIAKANPTLHADDFNVSKDGGAMAALGTTPTVTPAAGKLVKITLSAAEMNADNVSVVCSDVTDPPEWADLVFSIPTTA